jgi:octaprenyl-diphosphate synthase
MILHANQSVDHWLVQAQQLVSTLPSMLQPVAHGLVSSVNKSTTDKQQGRIA